MTLISFNDDSLKRHKVTRAEVLEVLADDFKTPVEFGESKQGNSTVMYVGCTKTERALEVGVEFLEDDADHVYHARSITHYFARAYKRLRKR